MDITRTCIWRKLRERRILSTHRRVVEICEKHIESCHFVSEHKLFVPKKTFPDEKIIWQYWKQGYDKVPELVERCLESVVKYCSDYTIIRLSDANLTDYLDLPDYVEKKKCKYSVAHFSDLLRLALLSTYGGVWLDATVLLTAPLPVDYFKYGHFVFRRDPEEPNIKYWRNTYAYYFGWAKGFRVKMLNSIIFAKKGNKTIEDLCSLLLLWWKDHDDVPDYFFFQILYDVYDSKESFPLVSDTLPHYMQQSINDPSFRIMPKDEIAKRIPIHKLSYK